MKGYVCLPKSCYQYGEYLITALRKQDILLIKKWRNDQIDILRQKEPLTDEQQVRYYKNTVLPLMAVKEPSDILFSYLYQGKCVGYGGLTHIDWTHRRAEVSFLLATARCHDLELYQKEFTVFLKLIKEIAFEELGLNRLFTETYDVRPYHTVALELGGFKLEGRMPKHVTVDRKFVDSLIHGCLREWQYVEK